MRKGLGIIMSEELAGVEEVKLELAFSYFDGDDEDMPPYML